jgi:hypothetical protein
MSYDTWIELLSQRQQALWLVVLLVVIALTWLVNARWVLKRGLPAVRVCLVAGYYLSLLLMVWPR